MNSIHLKKWMAVLVMLICFSAVSVPAAAGSSKIKETKDKIDQLQQQKDEASGRLDELK